MKTLKNYGIFADEYRLNEGLLTKAWNKIVDFFTAKYKKSAWLYYALFLKKSGQLPKEKVEIIVPSSYNVDDIPSEKEVELATESIKEFKGGYTSVYEDVINLAHDVYDNVDVDELVEEIIGIYEKNAARVKKGKKRTKNDALYIWGAPGIGKTEILNQVAEKLGCVVQEWHLSQIEPTDFRGVPKVENIVPGSTDPSTERTVQKLPAMFPTDDGPNGRGGIMFFDEINRAPKMVLSAALSLCLGGKIGVYELPEHWIVVAAGNRPEDLGGAVATAIEPALSNRFAHVNFVPTLANWTKWALTREDINPDLIAFLQFDKSYFHKLDPDKETALFPSPRSWELASAKDYFKRGEDWKRKLDTETIKRIYSRLVGQEAALRFVEYLKLKEFYDEKDVADVYKKGAKAKPLPTRLDQARAASMSIAFFKKAEKLTTEDLTNVMDFALSLKDLESRTSMISFFRQAHPYIKTDDPYKDIFWDYVKKWHIDLKELEK
jgi:hypothetical protein